MLIIFEKGMKDNYFEKDVLKDVRNGLIAKTIGLKIGRRVQLYFCKINYTYV